MRVVKHPQDITFLGHFIDHGTLREVQIGKCLWKTGKIDRQYHLCIESDNLILLMFKIMAHVGMIIIGSILSPLAGKFSEVGS